LAVSAKSLRFERIAEGFMSQSSTLKTVALRNSTLAQLEGSISRPAYDRSRSFPGLVHIGVGAFNRSHLAVYLDNLLARAEGLRWGEFGVGLLPWDKEIHAGLAEQDYLYSLMTMDTGEESLRVVGSLVGHLYAPEATEAVLERMVAHECAIVSLTVTEGGYFIDDASGRFREDDPDIRHDLEHSSAPRTWLGYVAEAAHRRMKFGREPFTLLSCDNLHANGDMARKALLSFAAARSQVLHKWIEANIAFPNSMVDRITPRTTDENRATIAGKFGVHDRVPVVTEPFMQWVLEDKFVSGRPAFEQVGVQIASNVGDFEKMKMRILNGGHLTLAFLGDLLGHALVSETAPDPQLRPLLVDFMNEVRPTVPPLPGIDLEEYSDTVLKRFSNTAIKDQVARICSEGCAKMGKFIVPSLADLLKSGAVPRVIPVVLAGWLHYQSGKDEQGRAMTMADAQIAYLKPFIDGGLSDARLALQVPSIFGDIAAKYPQFVASVQASLDEMRAHGVRAAIAKVLAARA
jgi:mannitol 2-dehydrogenase